MAKTAVSGTKQPHSYCTSSTRSSSQALTIFCDFDGPIVDVSDRYYSTYQQGLHEVQTAFQSEGITLPLHTLSKAQFWQMKQERTPDAEIAMRSGLRGQQIELFLQRVREIVNQPNLLHQDQIQPGVRWALTLLHAQGARLVLVTLRCQRQVEQILQQQKLAQFFSEIHGAKDEQAAYLNQADHKTQLLETAIESWQSKVSQQSVISHRALPSAWMIGDTEADILAGQATGIATIALTCGIRSQTYLQRFQPTQIQTDLYAAVNYLIQSKQVAA